MCDLCDLYGGGYERWYFNPANYARKLYKIRREEAEAVGGLSGPIPPGGMGSILGREIQEARERNDYETVARIKRETEQAVLGAVFGQVITLEEALKVVDIIYPIILTSCVCRASVGGVPAEENFVCMAGGPGQYKWERWPEPYYRGGIQFLTPNEAKEVLTKLDRRGLVHCIEAFGAPYIAGLCNCDYPDCGELRVRVDFDIKCLWKGHYVSKVDRELCNGCGRCIQRCQFMALRFVPSWNKAYVDQFQCFGCGKCRSECEPEAISLVDRASMPALANVW